MYTYIAHVNEVHDGDTITVDIDMGMNITLKNEKIRLYGINAPEVIGVSKPQGIISRDAVREKILNKDILLVTKKDAKEKFGRWLGIVTIDNLNLNDWLVTNNLAVVYLP